MTAELHRQHGPSPARVLPRAGSHSRAPATSTAITPATAGIPTTAAAAGSTSPTRRPAPTPLPPQPAPRQRAPSAQPRTATAPRGSRAAAPYSSAMVEMNVGHTALSSLQATGGTAGATNTASLFQLAASHPGTAGPQTRMPATTAALRGASASDELSLALMLEEVGPSLAAVAAEHELDAAARARGERGEVAGAGAEGRAAHEGGVQPPRRPRRGGGQPDVRHTSPPDPRTGDALAAAKSLNHTLHTMLGPHSGATEAHTGSRGAVRPGAASDVGAAAAVPGHAGSRHRPRHTDAFGMPLAQGPGGGTGSQQRHRTAPADGGRGRGAGAYRHGRGHTAMAAADAATSDPMDGHVPGGGHVATLTVGRHTSWETTLRR